MIQERNRKLTLKIMQRCCRGRAKPLPIKEILFMPLKEFFEDCGDLIIKTQSRVTNFRTESLSVMLAVGITAPRTVNPGSVAITDEQPRITDPLD